MSNLESDSNVIKLMIETVKETFENAKIFDNSDNNAVIPINFDIDTKSKIMFVVGTNASGKSIIGKIIEMLAREDNLIKRSCSMRNRTSGEFGQRMIFGTEDDNSTGVNSINATIMGLKSTIAEKNSVLILDEPDLGLAEEYSAALGQFIAKSVNENSENIGLILVVTHSKNLIKAALEELTVPFSKVYVGDSNISFDYWYESPFKSASIEDLLSLKEKSRETWKKIELIIKEK